MKLRYKGIYKNEEQLPKGVLPRGAVMFNEPDTPARLNLIASLYLIPAWLLAGIIIALAYILGDNTRIVFGSAYTSLGFLLAFVAIIPHELLHGICFGADAEAELYVSPKSLMAFVISTKSVSKLRFIWLSLCPSLVLGWLPLLVWAFLPYSGGVSDLLISFAFLSITLGCGDYMNAFNAADQMPRGSMQQLHGFHSYWFMP